MASGTVLLWNLAEIVSAIILLASLVLMAKFYREYLDINVQEMQNWKLITLGFAFYIAVKTHFTILTNVSDVSIGVYPWYVVVFLSLALLSASLLVLIGFYGLVSDYL